VVDRDDLSALLANWSPHYPNAGNELRVEEIKFLIAFTRELFREVQRNRAPNELGLGKAMAKAFGSYDKREDQREGFEGITTTLKIPVESEGVFSTVGDMITITLKDVPPNLMSPV
jgi:hypothetical protein